MAANPGFCVAIINAQRPHFNRGWPIGLVLLLLACTTPASPEVTVVTAFVASSMAEAIGAVASAFEPSGAPKVVIVSGSSDRLAAQINDGAGADLFVAADWASMELVEDANDPVVIATTHLTIAVAPGNPKQIQSLDDLERHDLVVVLAAAEVPLGRYSAEVLAKAGVEVHPASLELDAISVLGRVERGEADAGLVYAADLYNRDVEGVETADASWLRVEYPAALLGEQPGAADALFEYLLSDQGRLWLVTSGFEVP